MSGEDAPRPCPENLIVLEIKTNKQTNCELNYATASFKGHSRRTRMQRTVQLDSLLSSSAFGSDHTNANPGALAQGDVARTS
jgi:hypothetical protein